MQLVCLLHFEVLLLALACRTEVSCGLNFPSGQRAKNWQLVAQNLCLIGSWRAELRLGSSWSCKEECLICSCRGARPRKVGERSLNQRVLSNLVRLCVRVGFCVRSTFVAQDRGPKPADYSRRARAWKSWPCQLHPRICIFGVSS